MTTGVFAMPEELATELATFEAHRDELVGIAANKYVLIHGEEIVGTYESERDAINEGYRRFGNVPFLVKHVELTDRPLNFVSGLVRL
jgi:hypothetical protein